MVLSLILVEKKLRRRMICIQPKENLTKVLPVNRVISGWTEGLQLMSEGATYEFFIPSDLAYGNNPPPGSVIEPGSALIFEVELIDVNE